MKKIIMAFSVFCLASVVKAEVIECEMTAYLAGPAGMSSNSKKLTMAAEALPQGAYSKDRCLQAQEMSLSLSFCAQNSEITEGFDVFLDSVTGKNRSNSDTLADATFSITRKNKSLTLMSKMSTVRRSVRERLLAANLELPDFVEGDLKQIDEVIGRGVRKGVLQQGEVVLVKINSCER